MLRFVVAQISGSNPIFLVSTDLNLLPEQILRLYSYRFKIEGSFLHIEAYYRWVCLSFLEYCNAKTEQVCKSGTDTLKAVSGIRDKKLITAAFRAIQGYVMTACIAVGLHQICSLLFANEINASPLRWLRTKTNLIPSEASTADFMRKTIFKHFGSKSNFGIIRLIQQLQNSPADFQTPEVA